MFSKILIANRGEVAVRIIRACKEMGIKTVAVYSEADAEALHVSMADESYCIGGPLVSDSYLNQNAILTVAQKCRVEAIHPGYGLLSENADFAEECEKNHITFIGPSAEVIRKMGNKDEARKTMQRVKVPVIAGSDVLTDVKEAKQAAAKLGYPVLLKARSGGGGKGIRLVNEERELSAAYLNAAEEAKEAFGDGALYLEKYLTGVKHVEVQLLADQNGKIIILGERDCSIQYKNQKLIEECPAPGLSQDLREQMHEAARKAAASVGYVTVGTIEFLLAGSQFYFMEMNTRLQVEHSVTEMVCGIDIVKWQIRTAAGCPISFEQEDIKLEGHAIECRICAENADDFTPSCGKVQILHEPGGPNIRFDSALYQGCEVSPFYDSMLGKLIVCSRSRENAIRKMRSALSELIVYGVENNTDFHLRAISEESFIQGNYSTGFIDEYRINQERDGEINEFKRVV
ncbi:MAG TPA: acetyl-CoA carboxylase biotin carboxylase subunit [Lachnospiraceae bacterium]|nr:acetyl-CoA carboxylase biotin carboxylase subunit [Lachnospiraceae bacterium]